MSNIENVEDNPSPKIRFLKQVSLGKMLSQKEQSFLNQNRPTDIIKMSDRVYKNKSTGWTRQTENSVVQ